MQKYQDVVLRNGRPVSGATVSVTQLGGAAATIYSDNGATVISSVTTGSDGSFAFYAADGRYTVTISGAGFTTKTLTDILLEDPLDGGAVSVRGFDGFVGDGVTDDTAAVMAAHVYANSIGAPVSYAGAALVALQADAQIPMKTSTDFANARIVILGGVASPPTWTGFPFNTLFVVTDDDCPLVTQTGVTATGSLVNGSLTPTSGLFDGPGFAKITASYLVPDRATTGTQRYVQSFKVHRSGRASLPLNVDLTAYAAGMDISYRLASKRRLVIENLSVVEGAWNQQQLLKIQRCNVEINGTTMLYEGAGANFDNICRLIYIENASDVRINGFLTTARPVTTSEGSYCFSVNGGADIFVDGLRAITGWSAMGNNDINGLYVTNSTLNRAEAHNGCHNLFLDNCDIHNRGVGLGWGGGVVQVTNSRTFECPVIAPNSSGWGGTFFGSFVVRNVQACYAGTAGYTLVDMATDPLGASIPVYAPRSIEISNCTRVNSALSSVAEFIPLALKVRGATDLVYAPSVIRIDGITSSGNGWKFGLKLDWLNLEAAPGVSLRTTLTISDCSADSASDGTTRGIIGYASIRTPTTPVKLYLRAYASDNLAVTCLLPADLDMRFVGCNINGCVVDRVSAVQPLITFDSCRFITVAAAGTVVGGVATGSPNYFTIMRDCEIGNTTFDFSNVAAMSGCTIRKTGASVILPAGATFATAFTGWQKAAIFA